MSVTNLSFGSVAAGSSATLTATAVNSGQGPVTINSVSFSTTYFSLSSPSLPVTLAAGQGTPVSVKFAPNAAGTFNATATITTNSNTATVNLSGTGTGTGTAGELTPNPASLSFGSVTVGSDPSLSETVTNTGSSSVTISQVAISGSGFTLSGISTPITLTAGQSTSFSVSFAPTSAGSASGSVSITSNASNATLTIALSGTGTAASTYSVNLSWDASTSSNISGYNIYRAVYSGSSCGSFSKINSALNTTTLYTDSSVTDGTSYCYAATAVNSSDQESGYSNIVSNIQVPAS